MFSEEDFRIGWGLRGRDLWSWSELYMNRHLIGEEHDVYTHAPQTMSYNQHKMTRCLFGVYNFL